MRCLRETRHVDGWLLPIDAALFAMLAAIQRREGVKGNLFEIGVHHGKSAVLLARMANPGEYLGVCDVFDRQELNRDASGAGDRAIFERTMRAHAPLDAIKLRIFAKASAELNEHDTTTECRFVHIDGGHGPDDVMADLATAVAALLPDGIVAVDDVFNAAWPGVSEGLYRYMSAHPDAFAPIIIGGNKAYFTRPSARGRYTKYFGGELAALVDPGAYQLRVATWLGRDVLTALEPCQVALRPLAAAFLHCGRTSSAGEVVRSLVRAARRRSRRG